MFTGIIEATAEILEKTERGLSTDRPVSFDDVKIGSSIAVAGICLTVTRLDDRSMGFDVVGETWEKTKLQDLKAGDRVNLERAMKVGDRLEGHIVQGHVEGTGVVVSRHSSVVSRRGDTLLTVQLPQELLSCIIEKGSIAIDGVSLTIASVEGNHITVALIPHTIEHTTLGSLQEGERVNVETDILQRSHAQTPLLRPPS